MSSVRHLNKAPVQEALIDCQFTATWNRDLHKVCTDLAGSQGRVSDLFEASSTFTVDNEGTEPRVNPSPNSRVGKRIDFFDAQQVLRQVLQVKRTGFTFSQLAPYESWEQIIRDAGKVWSTLSSDLSDLRVSRLAVRYLNVIELPIPFDDFNEYLTAAPQIPSHLPQGLAQFLIRTVSPIENDLVIVTQSLGRDGISADKAKVVLDIDVSCSDTERLTGENLVDTLGCLRDRKNAVFFSYLTEKALEMYE